MIIFLQFNKKTKRIRKIFVMIRDKFEVKKKKSFVEWSKKMKKVGMIVSIIHICD